MSTRVISGTKTNMGFVRFLFGLAICFTFVASSSALAACGTLLGVQLYCPSGYHCCSEAKSTCCQDGYICISDDTNCLSVGVIIGPILAFIGIVICIVVCVICMKKKKVHQGTVIQPGANMQVQSNVVTSQQYGGQPYTTGQPYPEGQPYTTS